MKTTRKCLHCEESKPCDLFEIASFGQKYRGVCLDCIVEIKELAAVGIRKCRKCKNQKDLGDFKGSRHTCKKCNCQKEWSRRKEDGSMAEWRESHQENVIFTRIKGKAKLENIPFNLDLSDIVIPEFCPILGIKLQKSYVKGNPLPTSPSVDRINPNKGYVKGNIAIISFRANRIKNDATKEELQMVLDYVKNRSN